MSAFLNCAESHTEAQDFKLCWDYLFVQAMVGGPVFMQHISKLNS